MEFDTISVVGLGYIGLPTAAVFASRKVKVIGVDINKETVDIINCGNIHIVEPDLDVAVHDAVQEGFLTASTEVYEADAFLIAVPTPFGKDHEPDLSYIESAVKAIAPVLKKDDLVILESTSPVGTTEKMIEWMSVVRPDLVFPSMDNYPSEIDVYVAHCPERVLPGHVMKELIQNDRVIGGITPECSRKAAKLYRIFLEGECILTDAKTAELSKLAENAFRDVNIAYANELSFICDKLGINVWELIQLANRHPRVNILRPGPGVGGHCIAVDPWFIVSSAPKQTQLIRAARNINDSKPIWVVEKIKLALAMEKHDDPVVAFFGLSFKANIDDLRESPAIDIVSCVANWFEGRVLVVEPYIDDLPASLMQKKIDLVSIDYAKNLADIIVVLVDHSVFYDELKNWSGGRVLDTRGSINSTNNFLN